MVRNVYPIASLICLTMAAPTPNPTFGKLLGEIPGLLSSSGGSSEISSTIEGLTDLGIDAISGIAGAVGKKLSGSGVSISGGINSSGSSSVAVSGSGSGSGSIGSYGSSGSESDPVSTTCTSSVSAPTSTAPSGYDGSSSGESSSGEATASGNAGYGDDKSTADQPAGY